MNFPQILTQNELVPYIIDKANRHLKYKDLTSFNTTHLKQINFDHNFINEDSETSDNRPYTTTNVSPEPTLPEQITITPAQHVTQPIMQFEQDNLSDFSQRQESPQQNPLYPQLTQTTVHMSDIQTSNPSETTTTQDTLELSEETFNTTQKTQSFTMTTDTNNTQNFTITTASNPIQVPTHNITQDETNNTSQQATLNIIQEDTSVLSTHNTTIVQPSSTHGSPRQNYNPPPVPPQFETQVKNHNSPQQGSSNTLHTNTVHFQTPTPQSPQEVQTSTYTPAQNHTFQNVQPSLNIDTIHSNPPSKYTTSRHLSRPPLQTILTNPLSYNLTSTNSNQTQQTSTNNNQLNSLNNAPPTQMPNTSRSPLQNSQFHIPNPPSTTIRTNPHFHNTFTNSITTNSKAPA